MALDRFAVERFALDRFALDRVEEERVDFDRFADERLADDRRAEVAFRAVFLAVPDFFALRFRPAALLRVARATGRRAAGRSILIGSTAAAAPAAAPAAGPASS